MNDDDLLNYTGDLKVNTSECNCFKWNNFKIQNQNSIRREPLKTIKSIFSAMLNVLVRELVASMKFIMIRCLEFSLRKTEKKHFFELSTIENCETFII